MNQTFKLTGRDVIRLAERENLTIHCYANPLDDGGIVTIDVARQIAKDDPGLIYALVEPTGWRDAAGNHLGLDDVLGYNVCDYFTANGEYLGPDDDGIEPCWNDATPAQTGVTNE